MRKSDSDSEPKQQHHEDSLTSNSFFRSAADQLYSQQQRKQRLSTGSQHLDDLLSGGLELGEITQFYGAPTAGKTHLCHFLCVILSSAYQVIYIDTEGTFRIEKIQSIAKARGLNPVSILQNIHVEQPKNSKEQELFIEEACSTVNKSNSKIKLLIVDSMMFHYRAEYPGRSNLSKRAERLNIFMHMLRNLARTSNIAVVITNQSTSTPDAKSEFKDPRPFGGKVISYTSTYIINLVHRSATTSSVDARLVKSPLRRFGWHTLGIVESGFADYEK